MEKQGQTASSVISWTYNKEKVNARRKEYRKNNQDVLRAKQSEKVLCECGCYSVRSGTARHRCSDKPIRLVNAKGET